MNQVAAVQPSPERRLLTLNAGSSSLKFALFAGDNAPRRLLGGTVGGIGKSGATLRVRSGDTVSPREEPIDAPDHRAALDATWRWLDANGHVAALAGVGHRMVHGGPRHFAPERVTPELLRDLHGLNAFAPDHVPEEIALIEAVQARAPQLPQVVCFDTEFHRDLPTVTRRLPLPRRFEAQGIRRYGFHGLSYAFLMEELRRLEPQVSARGRVILAHLGNGASLAAVLAGRCIDTSMAFTPAAGIPMSTRCGDIDPGLLSYLARCEGLSAERLHRLVNFESGLLGLSETTGDLRELLEAGARDARAAEAVEVFCYASRKWIGAFAAALGGLDTLVFAGGVGEHAAEIRARICQGLGFLGVELASAANDRHAEVISSPASKVSVRVMHTDEERMIARALARTLAPSASSP